MANDGTRGRSGEAHAKPFNDGPQTMTNEAGETREVNSIAERKAAHDEGFRLPEDEGEVVEGGESAV